MELDAATPRRHRACGARTCRPRALVSVLEHRGQRIRSQQAPQVTIDLLEGCGPQASLFLWPEALELEYEQAAQRVDAAFLEALLETLLEPFLLAFFAKVVSNAHGTPSMRGSNIRILARSSSMCPGSTTWNM